MTDRHRRIIRNATRAFLGMLAVSTLAGCIAYGYPDSGYSGAADRGGAYRNGGYRGGYAQRGDYRPYGHDQGR